MRRRDFMGMLAAGTALGLSSCELPNRKIVPPVIPVEYRIAGEDEYYNITLAYGSETYPARLRSKDGKPLSIEPNSDRIRGILPYLSESLFPLYDPERFDAAGGMRMSPRTGTTTQSPDEAIASVCERIKATIGNGKKVTFFVRPKPYYSLEKLFSDIRALSSNAIDFLPVFEAYETGTAALYEIYGPSAPRPDLSKCDTVLSVETNFLGKEARSVRAINEFFDGSKKRHVCLSSKHGFRFGPADLLRTMKSEEIKSFLLSAIKFIKNNYPDALETIEQAVCGDLINESPEISRVEFERVFGKQTGIIVGEYADSSLAACACILQSALSSAGLSPEIASVRHRFARSESSDTADHIADSEYFVFCDSAEKELLIPGYGLLGTKKIIGESAVLSYYSSDLSRSAETEIRSTHYAESWSDFAESDGKISICRPAIYPMNDRSVSLEDFILAIGLNLYPEKFSAFPNYYSYMRSLIKQYVGTRDEFDNLLDKGYIDTDLTQTIIRGDLKIAGLTARKIPSKSADEIPRDVLYRSHNPHLEEIALLHEHSFDSSFSSTRIEHGNAYLIGTNDSTRRTEYKYVGYRPSIFIDPEKCTACGACISACNRESNIPPVGADEIAKGRSLAWLRIENITNSDPQTGESKVSFMPIMCMHCENAPCEIVCPVTAVTHSPDGLNETVYNACVGSRICMANCPYKVRKFNFYQYNETPVPPLENLANPEVTIRTRGTVEKCTMCIQRINKAKSDARNAGIDRPPDGSFSAACATACPTGAIVFGDLNDPKSKISALIAESEYGVMLPEKNTRPAVKYKINRQNRI